MPHTFSDRKNTLRSRRDSRTVKISDNNIFIDKIQIDEKRKIHERTEQYLKNIESIGQLVGEVL